MTVELWSFSSVLGVDAAELRGMSVEARDGGVGKVVDVVDRVGAAYLVVDTGPWIFGKKVVLPAGVITDVDRDQACVFIDRVKDDVKNAPQPDSDPADDVAHREALSAHYGAGSAAALGSADDASAAGVHGAGPRPAPFGAAESGGIETPPTSSTGGAEPAATPGVPSLGDSNDADTEEPAEPEFPAVTPAGWRRPDDGDSESLGSPSADITTTGPSDYDTAAQPSHGVASAPEGPTAADSEDSEPAGQRPSPEFEAGAPQGRAEEASAEVSEEEPRRTADATATRRVAGDADSSAAKTETTSRAGGKTRGARATGTSPDDVPIARYDSLTATQVAARLRNLSQRDLAKVERYEKRHDGRRTVLSRIESLRESEPWRGYDDATVDEIKKKLADANDDRARRVRDYERRHRDRKGVMEAARRTVASA